MVDARRLYGNRVGDAYTGEEGKKRYIFQCNGANEYSVMEVCERSYKVCEEEIIKRLDKINNLSDVKEFYDVFLSDMLTIFLLRDLQIYYNESHCEALLWPMLYSAEEYNSIQMNELSKYMERFTDEYIKKSGRYDTWEEYYEEAKAHTDIDIDIFKKVKTNLSYYVEENVKKNHLILKEKGIIK